MSCPATDSLERAHEWVDMLGPDKLVHLETLLSYWLVMPLVLCQHLCNLCEYLAIPTAELKFGERVDLPPVGALVETISAVGDCVTQSMRHLNAGHMSLMGGQIGQCPSAGQMLVQASTYIQDACAKVMRVEHSYATAIEVW